MTRPGGQFRGVFRAVRRLGSFLALTLPLMPLQWVFVRLGLPWAKTLPVWYHRRVLWILDVRTHVHGDITPGKPVLLVSNHLSWLDIPVLSTIAPLSFIAKREVGTWPFIASLAKLQRTVFIDRDKRSDVRSTADTMLGRLNAGDTVILFPEGTTSDGLRVLPFRSSLLSPAKPRVPRNADANTSASDGGADVTVQTCAVAYTHMDGMPLGRAGMPMIAWYGDMEIGPHAWRLLQAGPIDVHISLGRPIPLDTFADRKALARHTEAEINAQVIALIRSGGQDIRLPRPPSDAERTDPEPTIAPA